jgi:hypothetical protein
VVLPDGTLRGAWHFGGSFDLSGTLISRRTSDALDLIDLNGDWRFMLDGKLEGSCAVRMQQESNVLAEGSDIAAAFDCGSGISGALAGVVDPARGNVSLDGTMADKHFFFRGEPNAESGAIEGVWYANPEGDPKSDSSYDFEEQFRLFGCFAALPNESSTTPQCDPPDHHPSISVDCFSECSNIEPPEIQGEPLSTIGTHDGENETLAFVGVMGLAAGLAALGAWRLRLLV